MEFNLVILGYNDELSLKGLYQLARNNPEQVKVVLKDRRLLILKDGTYIKALRYGDIDRQIVGLRFIDQLILFDDNRWMIDWNSIKEISSILEFMKYRSRIPEDFRLLRYEYI